MAKVARASAPPHLPWFDDTPRPSRGRRGPTLAEKRAARARVRALARSLPRPVPPRAKPPKPIKSAGLQARSLNSLIGRAQLQVPRRLVILPPSTRRPLGLASRFAPR